MKLHAKEVLERWNREHAEWFQTVNLFVNAKHNREFSWADWCFVPISATIAAVRPEGEPTMQDLYLSGNLAILSAWRVSQGVYRFDPTLWRELWTTPVDDQIPVDVFLNLPEWCVYIEVPAETIGGCHGVWVHLEHDQVKGHSELRLGVDMDSYIAVIPMHLKPTLTESFSATAEYISSISKFDMSEISGMLDPIKSFVAHVIPHILYLCSAEADFIRPNRPNPKKIKSGIRYFDPDEPRIIEVGYGIGKIIRESGTGSHSGKAPHIRSAHFHTFRCGPGRIDSFIKWIPPIAVNAHE